MQDTLQHTATHCNTLQHTEVDTSGCRTHCNTLQHTATHCNTLQHTEADTSGCRHTYICMSCADVCHSVVHRHNSAQHTSVRFCLLSCAAFGICCLVLQTVVLCCLVLQTKDKNKRQKRQKQHKTKDLSCAAIVLCVFLCGICVALSVCAIVFLCVALSLCSIVFVCHSFRGMHFCRVWHLCGIVFVCHSLCVAVSSCAKSGMALCAFVCDTHVTHNSDCGRVFV